MSASGDIHAAVPPSGGEHRNVFVLSGGASRGAVQVGMLEVLLDAGIVPHALVGTSVGALNAAFLAVRPDHDRVRELRGKWLQLTTRDIFPGGTLTRRERVTRGRLLRCRSTRARSLTHRRSRTSAARESAGAA